MLRVQMITGVVSISILVIVFELIRRGKLKEEYSLLWLLSGVIILAFSVFPGLLDILSKVLGMYYLSALLVVSFLFLLFIVLHFSTVISRLSERNKSLTQELSILDFKCQRLDEQLQKIIGGKK